MFLPVDTRDWWTLVLFVTILIVDYESIVIATFVTRFISY